MQFSRRDFGKGIVCLAVAPTSMLTVEGCSGQAVINEINVVLKQAAAVLAVVEPGAPWLDSFQRAIGALMAAEQQWQNGGAVQILIDALNTVVAITSVIPVTAPYSGLIDILVAGIEAVLAALPKSSNNVGAKATAAGNPHIGRVAIKHRAFRSLASDVKAQWNEEAAHANLSSAMLK